MSERGHLGAEGGAYSPQSRPGSQALRVFASKTKKKGRGAASSFKVWHPEEGPIFSFFPLQRKEVLAKELDALLHSGWGLADVLHQSLRPTSSL